MVVDSRKLGFHWNQQRITSPGKINYTKKNIFTQINGSIMKLQLIAYNILKANKECALSGSLALQSWGLNLRNNPTDIDIWCPYGTVFNQIEHMELIGDNEGYGDEEDWLITQYKYKGVKIDIFLPNKQRIPNLSNRKIEGVNIVEAHDIIKFKVKFALGTPCGSQQKHLEDLAYILKHNCKNSNNQLLI